MTFKEWIKQFDSEDSPRGDLAKDICKDESFPDTDEYEKMIDHLTNHDACEECIQVFSEVYTDYAINK